FIEKSPALNRVHKELGMTPLKWFAQILKSDVQKVVTDPSMSSFDVLGNFYHEFISYGGGDGNTLGTFPPARQATPDNVLRIRADQPDALRQALEGLSNNEIRTLLDEEFGAGQLGMSPRLTTLRTRLVASARRSRAWLFESRYRTLKIGDVDGTPTLQKAFGGLPPM
ncbi:Leucine-rich repeat domain protein, partial [Pseudomonas syringae pv. maculicola]